MAVPLPPWLDVTPSDFVKASEAGAKLGAADVTANAALQRAELGRQAQESSMRAAQEQAALGLKQQELDLQVKAAAAKSQAQSQYQQLVGSGMDPVAAALRVGPSLLGESVGGLGTLQKAEEASQFKPTAMKVGDVNALQTSPGHWTIPHPGAEWQDAVRTIDGQEVHGQVNTTTGEFKAISSAGQVPTPVQKENVLIRLNAQRDKLISDNERYAEKLDAGDPADPSWSKEQQAAYNALKKRLSDLDAQISGYSGGGTNAPDSSSMTNKTSSGLQYSIVPSQ